MEAAPVNPGLCGEVDDGVTVGTIGDPVALDPEAPPTPVPVLPGAVPGAVPVANPVEPPDTPVELEDTSAIAQHMHASENNT